MGNKSDEDNFHVRNLILFKQITPCSSEGHDNQHHTITQHDDQEFDTEVSTKLCHHLSGKYKTRLLTDTPRDPRRVKFNQAGGLPDRNVNPPPSPPPPPPLLSPPRRRDHSLIGIDFKPLLLPGRRNPPRNVPNTRLRDNVVYDSNDSD